MRAFTRMWDRICEERYGVTDEKLRRFRYGMQVNSLGLTEEQPENNVQRIVLEMLGVTLSKDARARAIQLPCWNEALGLPTPWDQQWSLRIQQVLAYESDLLEYGDLFEGSVVVERKVAELCAEAEVELQWVLDGGGSFAMIDEMKGADRAVGRRARAPHRVGRVEGRRRQRVHRDRAVAAGRDRAARRHRHDRSRDRGSSTSRAIAGVARGAGPGRGRRGAGDSCRRSRRPRRTSCRRRSRWRRRAGPSASGRARCARCSASTGRRRASARSRCSPAPEMEAVRELVRAITGRDRAADPAARGQARPRRPLERRRADRGRGPRRRLRGRSTRASGSRRPRSRPRPATRTSTWSGLSILSGSHLGLVPETLRLLREAGVDAPVVVGGIIPDADRAQLEAMGVARVYTPKDYRLSVMMRDLAELARIHRSKPQAGAAVGR